MEFAFLRYGNSPRYGNHSETGWKRMELFFNEPGIALAVRSYNYIRVRGSVVQTEHAVDHHFILVRRK